MRLRTGRIFALLLAAALSSTALALADSRTVRDERRETRAIAKNGRLDIVRAKVDHRGKRVRHVVVMRRKVDASRKKDRPLIILNTRGGRRSEHEFVMLGTAIFRNGEKLRQVADAKLTARGRRWIYRFDPRDLDLNRYGWLSISTRGNVYDTAPSARYAIHQL